MRRAIAIKQDLASTQVIEDLASVFESIASIRIGKVRNRVLNSKRFFAELWQIYTMLRTDPSDRITSEKRPARHADREARVVITSEGGLTGDIDERIVDQVLSDYDPATTDIIVVGDHGAKLFSQRKVAIKQHFTAPDSTGYVDVSSIVGSITDYGQTTAYYETYLSLSVQQTAKIDLVAVVKSMSDEVASKGSTISSRDYVFEPSLGEVVEYLENTMISLALSQLILESRLAQDASRFNAMNAAKDKASDLVDDYKLTYNRAKRAESDSRLKEVIVSLNNSASGEEL